LCDFLFGKNTIEGEALWRDDEFNESSVGEEQLLFIFIKLGERNHLSCRFSDKTRKLPDISETP